MTRTCKKHDIVIIISCWISVL